MFFWCNKDSLISLEVKETNAVVLKLGSLDQRHLYHLGTYQKCKSSGTPPDLLNQKFWGQGQQSVSQQAPQVIILF